MPNHPQGVLFRLGCERFVLGGKAGVLDLDSLGSIPCLKLSNSLPLHLLSTPLPHHGLQGPPVHSAPTRHSSHTGLASPPCTCQVHTNLRAFLPVVLSAWNALPPIFAWLLFLTFTSQLNCHLRKDTLMSPTPSHSVTSHFYFLRSIHLE